jgi:hypothetical protein
MYRTGISSKENRQKSCVSKLVFNYGRSKLSEICRKDPLSPKNYSYMGNYLVTNISRQIIKPNSRSTKSQFLVKLKG